MGGAGMGIAIAILGERNLVKHRMEGREEGLNSDAY
jgi:hypothetical protein